MCDCPKQGIFLVMLQWISQSVGLHTCSKRCKACLLCFCRLFLIWGIYLCLSQLRGNSWSEGRFLSCGVGQKKPKQNPNPQKAQKQHWWPGLGWCAGFGSLEPSDICFSSGCGLCLPLVQQGDTGMAFHLSFGVLGLHHESLCPSYFHLSQVWLIFTNGHNGSH